MKRRRGVTVFSVLTTAFLLLAVASYVVIMLVVAPMFAKQAEEAKVIGEAFDFMARNKDIVAAFTTFDPNNLMPNALVFGYIGLFVVVAVIWLIVGLRRGRKISIFFCTLFLLSMYVDLLYNLTVLPLQDFITQYVKDFPALFIPLGGAVLGALASLFALILFIVDMATGSVEKAPAPAFIKEPTEEVEEGVFEEVKDESEVEQEKEEEKEEEVAPLAVEEAPKAEEEKKPAKKPSAPKKVNKPEPKKEEAKPAPKKEPAKKEAKPAPKKAEPKKEEPKKEEPKKDDARKTQTVTLVNEDGQVYAKAYHVSRRPELNKWQVKATGSDKALKLFNTQKEAIEYAEELGKNQNVGVRVHSKAGKIRKHQ